MSTDTPPSVTSTQNFASAPNAAPVDRILAALIDGLICIPLVCTIVGPLVYGLTKDALPFLKGQSVGKKVMKIRAVTATGDSLEGQWGPAIIRQVGFMVPYLGFVYALVELVVLFTGKDGLRFGDKWAKTKVVKVG